MKYSPKELKNQKNGFIFNADKFLSTILPSRWSEKRLISIKNNIVEETNLLAETTANMVTLGLKNKKEINKTIKDFSEKYGSGLANTSISKKLPHGQNLLRNRVENTLLYENVQNIESAYKGRHFIWLPSGAKEPRHTHMLRYGKIFEVGGSVLPEDDNFPGKAYGCKCGYQWVEDPVTTYSTFDEEDVDIYRYTRVKKLEDEKPLEQLMLNVAIKTTDRLLTNNAIKNAEKQLKKTYKDTTFISSVKYWQAHNTASERINLNKSSKTDSEKIAVQDIQNAANYPKILKNMTVYRGTDLENIGFDAKIGMRIKIGRGTFTSLSKRVAEKFTQGNKRKGVILKFELKAGTKILPTYPLSLYPEELEMLLPPLNTFKITDIIDKKGSIPIIVLTSVAGKGKFKTLSG